MEKDWSALKVDALKQAVTKTLLGECIGSSSSISNNYDKVSFDVEETKGGELTRDGDIKLRPYTQPPVSTRLGESRLVEQHVSKYSYAVSQDNNSSEGLQDLNKDFFSLREDDHGCRPRILEKNSLHVQVIHQESEFEWAPNPKVTRVARGALFAAATLCAGCYFFSKANK